MTHQSDINAETETAPEPKSTWELLGIAEPTPSPRIEITTSNIHKELDDRHQVFMRTQVAQLQSYLNLLDATLGEVIKDNVRVQLEADMLMKNRLAIESGKERLLAELHAMQGFCSMSFLDYSGVNNVPRAYVGKVGKVGKVGRPRKDPNGALGVAHASRVVKAFHEHAPLAPERAALSAVQIVTYIYKRDFNMASQISSLRRWFAKNNTTPEVTDRWVKRAARPRGSKAPTNVVFYELTDVGLELLHDTIGKEESAE